ncbi:SIR2 family NAD-dependent protein deacylase [Croceitalea rosinachiae]|uniref:SIR2 family protein n=1 Tax=Croceitalea rosinachiae TaxID=3075596 RepID=A0ABU3A7F4_9FLAO|nr:SIR2 family protein [Croceitalea sp. F388]MDT0606096.1 SIR2 family protein [Croceitalea sp. F388]
MSVLENTYTDSDKIVHQERKIWCDEDKHELFEFFTDFNEWLDSDEAQDIRIENKIEGLAQPSKALYSSDSAAYNQVFKIFREEQKEQILAKTYIGDLFGDEHWYEKNESRFEQLVKALVNRSVVPFVGAGLSVEGGFPAWGAHLRQQGRTSGIPTADIDEMLGKGQYEQVIEEIEKKGFRDTFIQELKDVFSKTGKLTDTTLRLSELFNDTIITTNYDQLIEQAFETGAENTVQLIGISNIAELPEPKKTTIFKLHGDIDKPAQCILGKDQYDEAYGKDALDLKKPIPKLLSYHYKTSSLLFLGCSLYQDRTMRVFHAVKEAMGDTDRPPHFSLESMPEDENELINRNSYLLEYGIIPIWFPKGCYEYIEQILRLAKNELRYIGQEPGQKSPSEEPENQETVIEKKGLFSTLASFFGIK